MGPLGDDRAVQAGDDHPGLGVLPAGLRFADNGDGTGTISGTPAAAGTYGVTIRARNRTSPAVTQDRTITVSAAG